MFGRVFHWIIESAHSKTSRQDVNGKIERYFCAETTLCGVTKIIGRKIWDGSPPSGLKAGLVPWNGADGMDAGNAGVCDETNAQSADEMTTPVWPPARARIPQNARKPVWKRPVPP